VIVLLLLAYLISGFYTVKSEQRGVLLRFGKVVDDNIEPGIHYRFPWPIESVLKPRVTEIQNLLVQFETVNPNSGQKTIGHLLTGDENVVLIVMNLQYTIKEASNYLFTTSDPGLMLKRIVESVSIPLVGSIGVDDILTTGKQSFQIKVRESAQKLVDEYKLGVRINSVLLQRVDPPPEVAMAFKDVSSAREDRHKLVQQQRGAQNRKLGAARGSSEKMRLEAESYAKERVQMATGDAERFKSTWNEYRKAKDVTAYRIYMETMEKIIPRVRKIMVDPDAEKNMYR